VTIGDAPAFSASAVLTRRRGVANLRIAALVRRLKHALCHDTTVSFIGFTTAPDQKPVLPSNFSDY
jgi:hypothetical protein